MDLIIKKGSLLEGVINIPSSKSQTLRAIYQASLAKGVSLIKNALDSEDVHAMINVMRQFGVRIIKKKEDLVIFSPGIKQLKAPHKCFVNDSGIVLRFVSAFAAHFKTKIVFSGSQTLNKQRSIQDCQWGLDQLSVTTASQNGFCPFTIQGPIKRKHIFLKGSDSQPVSAILWLLAIQKKKTVLSVLKPGEKPWVNLTLSWLKKFHKNIVTINFQHYRLSKLIRLQSFVYNVPCDFSSLAFVVVAGLFGAKKITIPQLDFHDAQGDKSLIYLLKSKKANIKFKKNALVVEKTDHLELGTVDVNSFIDALPVLSVISLLCRKPVILTNAQAARGKESDRILSMKLNLEACGIKTIEQKNQLTIYPGSLSGGICQSFSDHRVAMACSLLGLLSDKPVIVKNIESINKTYPDFIKHLRCLGAHVELSL